MRKIVLISLLSCFVLRAGAQISFRTYVPAEPVITGVPFQVQFFVNDGSAIEEFRLPELKDFQFVSGPYIYSGKSLDKSSDDKSRNYVITLIAKKPGSFPLKGAVIVIDGHAISSNNVIVHAVDAGSVSSNAPGSTEGSEYFLRPGEDVRKKIRENLFVRVEVSKKNCFVGEPVTAKFKLYSRLQSRSDIVKNPGFYGFTVYDIIGVNDRKLTSEIINGKVFDVHTIREVQLYPLQEGKFEIDPMEIVNQVEFSKSVVNKKAEQEIIEGVFDDQPGFVPDEDKEIVENTISTAAVTINVNPFPSANKPSTFNGSTGDFEIQSSLSKQDLLNNEQGILTVIIEGSGNFTQMNPPVIEWPQGLEGFDPVISDELDKTQVPLAGKRIFKYSFVTTAPGNLTIPPVKFSFFNPGSNRYREISSRPLPVQVSSKSASPLPPSTMNERKNRTNSHVWLFLIGGAMLALIATYFFVTRKKKAGPEKIVTEEISSISLIRAQPLNEAMTAREYYSGLQKDIWQFLDRLMNLKGSKPNKKDIVSTLTAKGVSHSEAMSLVDILNECEIALFTGADIVAADRSADVNLLFNRIYSEYL